MQTEIGSFYIDHVCDSNLVDFPCPCRICKRMISSYEFYDRGCYTCDRQDDIDDGKCSFIIHKSCTQTTPRHIQRHPFHPQHDLALSSGHDVSSEEDICDACGDNLKMGFVYKCTSSDPQCSFTLDVKCAILTLANVSSEEKFGSSWDFFPHVDHGLHPHQRHHGLHPHQRHHLISCNMSENFSYVCTCCKLPFNNDESQPIRAEASTTLLVCLECKALLHKSCAKIPWNIEKHPFHPSHPLVLLPRVPFFKCNLCRQEKQNGFAYHCLQCGIFLDVHCASLKPKRNNGDDDDFQQLSHFHPLIVCEDKENTFPHTCYSCGACGQPIPDGSQIYYCHECECLLDKSCADDLAQDIKHALHPEHELTFWYRPLLSGHRKCRACLSSIGDSGYQCFKCAFYLDIKCSRSDYTVQTSPLHRKPLVLHEAADRKQYCNVCNKRCHTSFYRSLARDFVVHVHCMKRFPTEIQSSHRHPLTLRELTLEELNNWKKPTVTSKRYVPFSLPPPPPPLPNFTPAPLLRHLPTLPLPPPPLPNFTPAPLLRHLPNFTLPPPPPPLPNFVPRPLPTPPRKSFVCWACRGTEPTNPLYSCKECPFIAHPQCVFSEKMTFEDFKNSFTSDETMEVESVLVAYKEMDEPNWLYDSRTATTDIEKRSQKLRFPWEDWDAKSKVIEIETGIWILEEFAPLLKALFRKYGDFCSGSHLSPYPKMLFVTTVCEVLHNMSTNVADVTKNLLLTWFQGFALGKHAGLDMAFAFDRLLRVATAQFSLHAGIFIDPNFARVRDDEATERQPTVLNAEESAEYTTNVGDSLISLGKFKLHDEIKELGKEREEVEATLKEKPSMYDEWKKEWLTDTLDLLREKAFDIHF